MAIIALEGMHFFAHHGFYEEEQIVGNNFILDVYIDTETSRAAVADDLYSTINYETVYFICKSEMKKPAKLLETLAQQISNRLNSQFETLSGVKVRVRKMAPPLGGRVDSTYVEVASGTLSSAMGFPRYLKGEEEEEEGDDFNFLDLFK